MPSQSQTIDDNELPAAFRLGPREKHALILPATDFDQFVDTDQSLQRLEGILKYLWLAGRPYPPRPLSSQTVLQRTTIPTSDASLHLVWVSGKVYLKPLPRYATTEIFYERFLRPVKPHNLALGFVFTYIALVPTELDFSLAHKDLLLPPGYRWSDWKALVARILTDYPNNDIYNSIHERYVYGELRHDRLDKIHRYLGGDWLHGFSPLMGASTYGEFLIENLGPIAGATIYIVLVLTAMQVVLATETVNNQGSAFVRASYGFAIFAIVAPLAALAVVLGLLVIMLFANWSRTTASKRRRYEDLGIEQQHKKRSRAKTDPGAIDLMPINQMPRDFD